MTWSLVGALQEMVTTPPIPLQNATPDVDALPIEVQDTYVAALAYGLDKVADFILHGAFDAALEHAKTHDDMNPIAVLANVAWKQVEVAQRRARGRKLTYDVVREWFEAVSEELWRRNGCQIDCAVWGGQIESRTDSATFTARCSGIEWTEDHVLGQRGRLPCLGRQKTFRPYAVLRFLPKGKGRHRTYAVRCLDWAEERKQNPKGSYYKPFITYHMTEVPK